MNENTEMKMNKKRVHHKELAAEKARCFMGECRRLLAGSGNYTTVAGLTAAAARRPAPAYFVSYLYALDVVYHYRKTGELRVNGNTRRSMWMEIINRTHALMEADKSLSVIDALAEVLRSEASCYFLSDSAARTTYYNERRRCMHRRRHMHPRCGAHSKGKEELCCR